MDPLRVSLDVRMKQYEKDTPAEIPLDSAYLIRLDGKKFSSFVRGFERPADVRIHNAMVATALDLLKYMNATTAYTCSDEITLAFPLDDEGEQPQRPYNGRRSKIESLIASRAAVVFFKTLTELCADDAKRLALVHTRLPHFDARVIVVPSNVEVVNNILWRMRDFRKNSISALADVHFSAKRLHGLHGEVKLALLQDEKGIVWETMPLWSRAGTFVKRALVGNPARTKAEARNVETTLTYGEEEKRILACYWEE